MDCNTCKENRQTVPYIVYESAMVRNERQVRRLVVALIVAIAMIALSNFAWLYAWMQYDYTSEETVTTYQQDGEGTNIIGDSNQVTNDGSESDGH